MGLHQHKEIRCYLSIVNKVATSNCKNGLVVKY